MLFLSKKYIIYIRTHLITHMFEKQNNSTENREYILLITFSHIKHIIINIIINIIYQKEIKIINFFRII